MTIWEEFVATSRSGVFWVCLILAVLGIAFSIYLAYRGKDKIASFLVSIPLGIMAMFVINVITHNLFMDVSTMWVDYAIMPSISIFSFSTVVWLCKKFLVKIIKKLFGFQVVNK